MTINIASFIPVFEVGVCGDTLITMTSTPDIQPGTLATYSIGSDRYAMIVVRVERHGRTLQCTFKDNVPADSDINEWADRIEAAFNERNVITGASAWHTFTLRDDGKYRGKGAKHGAVLTLGHAEDYRDPSF